MTTLGIETETAIDVEEERRERQKKIYRVSYQKAINQDTCQLSTVHTFHTAIPQH